MHLPLYKLFYVEEMLTSPQKEILISPFVLQHASVLWIFCYCATSPKAFLMFLITMRSFRKEEENS